MTKCPALLGCQRLTAKGDRITVEWIPRTEDHVLQRFRVLFVADPGVFFVGGGFEGDNRNAALLA